MRHAIAVCFVVAAAATSAAAPPKSSPATSKPIDHPSLPVALALPDLVLVDLGFKKLAVASQPPGALPCWTFNLQPAAENHGGVASGPFKVVWERADVETGPYANACPVPTACEQVVPGIKPGWGYVTQPRTFDNCRGPKWYRVRLDPDNAVRESREDNNSKTVRF